LRSILLTFLIAATLSPRQVAAQTDPRSPTNPSDPLKLLIAKLNDPQRGAALRARWNIDRAVWNEPVTAVKNGVTVLLTPAHAEIHTSIDSAGAKWRPDGPLISAPHNPTAARLFIPRGYQSEAPTRMIAFAPGGSFTEYSFEQYGVRSPVLRRGYVLCVINAWSPVATPIPLAQWGPRLNEIVVFAQRLLTSALGLPRPTFTYAWGESRGARMLAYSSELAGTPFDGVIENRGGGDLVESALEQIQMLRALRADDQVLADYITKIGRRMKITARNGSPLEEFIPISPGDDERFFFKLPPTAHVLMPIIPPFSDNPVTASDSRFRVPAGGGNRSGGDNPFDGTLAWSAGPINTRRFLSEVDPAYAAAVDNGTVLLRNWDPKMRPAEVRDAIARLTSSGQIKTKVLKVHGTLDPNIYPLTAITYVQKIVDQNLSNQLRWYFVPGMGHVRSTLEETFVDPNGKTISLGVQLSHLDLLMNWVEKGIDPGDFVSVDPTDSTKTIAVKGAHQLGLQKSPLQYFWAVSGKFVANSSR
jgi:tannase/feruloyl esterase